MRWSGLRAFTVTIAVLASSATTAVAAAQNGWRPRGVGN